MDKHAYHFFLCIWTMYLLGNGEDRSLPRNVGDATKPAVDDSAFSLPPSRHARPPSADKLLPVPVAARPRDDRATTKPRIWSLAEVATSTDYRPKQPPIADSVGNSVVVEFRPWNSASAPAAESARRSSTEARLGVWQTAFVSAGNLCTTTPDTRWHRNVVDSGVSSHAAD